MADAGRDRRNALRAAMIVRGMDVPPRPAEVEVLDVECRALLQAIEEYIAERDAARAWNAAAHPRIPKGQPGAGRFRSMVDRLKESIDGHLSGTGGGHPFDGYNREQLRRVARARGIQLEWGESRDSIAAKLLEHVMTPEQRDARAARQRAADEAAARAAAAADPAGRPTSSPTRMTKGQYTKLLKDEHVRLAMLDGMSERDARAAARPAATIDQLKARNAALRNKLRSKGVDYRTDEQRNTDGAEKNGLLDEVERLATAGGHDGAGKRAAAARMSVPELRKFVADAKAYQQRQAERQRAAQESDAARVEFERRQAALPASPRQVDYILNLLRQRARSGEGGGFMVGPTDRAGIARMSRADATAYINSLTGNY